MAANFRATIASGADFRAGRRRARSGASLQATARSETERLGKSLYDVSADADLRVLERGSPGQGPWRADRAGRARLAAGAKGVTAPIVGATRMQHLDDAVAALSVKLSDEDTKLLEEPDVPHASAGFA